jgi:hypothetical protein
MKKIFMNVALVGAMLMGNAVSASAQVDLGSLGSAIGSVINGNKTSDSKGGIVNSLVSVISGDKAASNKTIAGTWNYSEPSIAFTSDSFLTQMGGKYAAKKIEDRLGEQLKRLGIKPGAMQMVFDNKGNFTSVINGKKTIGTYAIKGTTITLTSGVTKINGYAQISGKTLSLSFDTTKLLTLLQTAGNIAGNYNSTIKTITSLSSNIKGMKTGLAFKKVK